MEKEENIVSADIEDNNGIGQNITCLLPISKDLFRSSHFSAVLSKIDEVDESRIKSPPTSEEGKRNESEEIRVTKPVSGKVTQSPHVMWKSEDEIIHIDDDKRAKAKQRPKSANSVTNRKVKRSAAAAKEKGKNILQTVQKGSSSSSKNSDSESNSESSLISVLGRPRSAGSKPKNHSLWHEPCTWDTFPCPSRPRSACCMRTCFSDDCYINTKGTWLSCHSKLGRYQPRKCRSNPNLSKRPLAPGADLQIERFKRSLKLLGLEVTDFGIYDTVSDVAKYRRTKGKVKNVESTFTTKVVKRSISLDGLKEEVREAWLDDRLDISHRKLLAQAAYEEWYFRKVEEAQRRLANEKVKNKIIKEKLEHEFQSRKIKAEEQFKKWIQGKKKVKTDQAVTKSDLEQFKVIKSREEVNAAYKRWKKEKDKQREEKQKLELIEKEKEINEEKQKVEKKAMAERAFREWKKKLEEAEKKTAEAKLQKEKREKDRERKKELEKKTSFQTWREMKDKELMIKRLENRKALQIAKALRSAQMEERMYEAEQAFEEWLEKIELREDPLKSNKSVS